jgi:WD repeat-containing protein 23
MSQFNKDKNECMNDGSGSSNESSASGMDGKGTSYFVHDVAQMTKLRSSPHENLSRVFPGRMKLPASTLRMLVGRECNYSGRGKFSAADGCHVLSRYLPTKGPWIVDRMGSRAYVSQFSDDGSLFVAGFQVIATVIFILVTVMNTLYVK